MNALLRCTCIFCLFALLTSRLTQAQTQALPLYRGIGGDFTLDSTHNHRLTLSALKTPVALITFGYTNCSDVCPVTLAFLNQTLKALQDEASKVQVLFVSLDDTYDLAPQLADYLRPFNPDFVGLTGTAEEIAAVARQYHIRYSKTSDLLVDTGYRKKHLAASRHAAHGADDHSAKKTSELAHSNLFSHSTTIYLLDADQQVRAVFDTTSGVESVRDAVLLLLQEP